MKRLVRVLYAIPVCGSAWDYLKKVCSGFSNGTVGLNTPVNELGAFLFFDCFWLLLLIYAVLSQLIPFFYKKIQHGNAERKKKKIEKEKQKFFKWLDEYTN